MNCKRLGIKPIIIFSWINDLFSWYSPSGNLGSLVNGKRIDGEEEEEEEERNDKKRCHLPSESTVPFSRGQTNARFKLR